MKKSKVTRSLLAACSIVALSVAVSACVHNGDSDPVTDDDMTMMPDVDPADAAKDALDKANLALTEATTADAMAQTTLDAANTAVETAVTALTALDATATAAEIAAATSSYRMALADQTAAQSAADTAATALTTASATYSEAYAALKEVDPDAVGLIEARAKIKELEDAAKMAADKAKSDLEDLEKQIGDATKKLAALQKQIDDAADAADAAMVAAMAAGYTSALSTDARTAADRRASTIDGAALTVARTASVMMKAADFVAQSGAPASIGTGWTGQTLKKDKAGDQETVMATVYTDIEAPTKRALDSSQWTATNFPTAFPGATAVPTVAAGKATITLAGAGATQTWPGSATGSKIPTSSNTTESILASDPPFMGTLHGVSGTFQCTTGTCTIKKIDATTYAVSDDLQFIASPNAMVNIQDADYLTFGWWVAMPDNGIATDYEFGSFATGTATAAAVADTMEGTATYKGPAAGVYAEKKHGAQMARSGSFTADAALTANFGVAANTGYISGSVTNFMENGESLGKWMVTLGGDMKPDPAIGATAGALVAADSGTTALEDGASGTVVGLVESADIDGGVVSASFDGLTGTGDWQAQFSDSGTVTAGDAPVHVTGTFNATVGVDVLNVSGAFGADKQ